MTTELTANEILALIDAEIERYDAMDHQHSRGDGQQALVLELLKTKILEAKIARVESAAPAVPAPTTDAPQERHHFSGLVDDNNHAILCVVPNCHRQADRRIDAGPVCKFHEAYTVPAPRVPDALVPIHGDPLDGLRKAIEGHAALSKLEAMTKLYEIQRMAKDIISSDFGSVTPQVVIRLRGLRIEEMGPSDCVIELIKLAEMLAPGMTLSAAQVTAPIPSLDSAAGNANIGSSLTFIKESTMVKLTTKRRELLARIKSSEGFLGYKNLTSSEKNMVKWLEENDLVARNHDHGYEALSITPAGIAALAQR